MMINDFKMFSHSHHKIFHINRLVNLSTIASSRWHSAPECQISRICTGYFLPSWWSTEDFRDRAFAVVVRTILIFLNYIVSSWNTKIVRLVQAKDKYETNLHPIEAFFFQENINFISGHEVCPLEIGLQPHFRGLLSTLRWGTTMIMMNNDALWHTTRHK